MSGPASGGSAGARLIVGKMWAAWPSLERTVSGEDWTWAATAKHISRVIVAQAVANFALTAKRFFTAESLFITEALLGQSIVKFTMAGSRVKLESANRC